MGTPAVRVGKTAELVFAGDHVRLSGQIDYPDQQRPHEGFPLIFVLHHAGCDSRDWYWPFVEVGLQAGFAVFRWDKRGTGRSGAGGRGSPVQDAVNAYEIALEQQGVNRRRVVILAQGAGTGLLGNAYGLFARLQAPTGVILASNMLDEDAIVAIDSHIQIIMGDRDWNPWQRYAEAASTAHNQAYHRSAQFTIAAGADRSLMQQRGPAHVLHPAARQAIADWLPGL
jgi:alpha-beta hydrolase superfamily lysophospholipase